MEPAMNNSLNIHFLQHVPFEDSANIGVWAAKKGHKVSRTKLFEDESFPDPDSVDWLIILGGLMNVYEYDNYPWLLRERQFLNEMIKRSKGVLGICLGAQLIADVLGAKVKRNRYKEIGWHPVTLTAGGKKNALLADFPDRFIAFQWHGDTFAIPRGCRKLARSGSCSNQAFVYGDKVLAMQFHLDYSEQSIRKMIKNCGYELKNEPFIQMPDELLRHPERFRITEQLLYRMLDRMEKNISAGLKTAVG